MCCDLDGHRCLGRSYKQETCSYIANKGSSRYTWPERDISAHLAGQGAERDLSNYPLDFAEITSDGDVGAVSAKR